MDILLPHYPEASYEGWVGFEFLLPAGFRMVASVERPDGSVYDLGQNADGIYRLFRRATGEFENSHCKGESLSDLDLQGFGLTRDQSPHDDVETEGNFSSLCLSNLIRSN